MRNDISLKMNIGAFTIIVIVLYWQFLSGDKIYAYLDVGADTINSYLPTYIYLLDKIHEGNLDFLITELALGHSIFEFIAFLIDPFIILLAIVPTKFLPNMLIIVAIMKLFMIDIISYKTWSRYFTNNMTCSICSLIWTFNGYNILWGQHYHFLTAMMYFTAYMYFLDSLIFDEKKYVFLTMVMIVFCCNTPYFFYIVGVFTGVYLFAICKFIKKERWQEIGKKISILLCLALFAIGCSSGIVLPWIGMFLESSRIEGIVNWQNLFVFDWNSILIALGRMVNNNFFGQNVFSGSFYDSAILSSSSLFFLAAIYLINNGKSKIIILSGLIVGLLLFIPFGTLIFTFAPNAQRWTFFVIYMMMFIIGNFLDSNDKINEKYFLIMIFFLGIYFGEKIYFDENMDINVYVYIIGMVFLFIYISYFIANKKRNIFRQKGLIVIVIVELILSNIQTINSRAVVSSSEWNLSMYNDQTKQIIRELENRDDGFYRINKNYMSVYLNDVLVQRYNGLHSYSSFNSATLYSFLKSTGNELSGFPYHPNFLGINHENYVLATLLGTKYFISRDIEMDIPGYEFLEQYNDKFVYFNRLYLPFGYTYFRMQDRKTIDEESDLNKCFELTCAFYFTDDGDEKVIGKLFDKDAFNKDMDNNSRMIKFDFFANPIEKNNCEVDCDHMKMEVLATTVDPMLIYEIKNLQNGKLKIEIEIETEATLQIFWASDKNFNEEMSKSIIIVPEINEYVIDMENIAGNYLRIDPINNEGRIIFKNIEYMMVGDQYDNNIEALKKVSLQDIQYKDSTLKGWYENDYGIGMMCIPFSYSKGYHLKIDGIEQKIYNINGGLIGFLVENGQHEVELKYIPYLLEEGMGISLFSLSILIVSIIIKNKTKEL